MRHRKSGVKLSRTASHRKAMFRNMVTSLFKNDRIQTTEAKAKELRGWADHLVTLAKRGDLHARRQALSIIREKDVVHKLFENAGERFGSLSGGYTRIVKLGIRSGDAAPMSLVELVTAETTSTKSKKKKTAKRAKAPAAKKKTEAPKKAPAEKAAEKEKATQPAKEDASESGGAEAEGDSVPGQEKEPVTSGAESETEAEAGEQSTQAADAADEEKDKKK